MEDGMHYRVVIFVGTPGSGKDTQAEYLVRELGMLQVPSSQIIQEKFAANPDDPVIRKEREKFDAGFLNDPALVGQWIMEFVRAKTASGVRLVFSGSPRTVPEGEVELQGLGGLFGLQRVVAINLTLDEDVARERIKKRRFCKANKHAIPGTPEFSHLKACPLDNSELYIRPLDDPKLLDQRFDEYRKLTAPTIKLLQNSGVPFFTIDGAQSILAIHHEVVDIVERGRAPAPIA
jgi:adenylate kinase